MTMNTIAVWFSCGSASAVAAKLTLAKYGTTHRVRVVNNPVAEEDPDNLRFLRDVSDWLGVPIEIAINPKYPNASAEEVWEKRSFMSGPRGAPCTLALKKAARQEWARINKPDYHVLGFTYEERARHNRFVAFEQDNTLPVLIDAKLTKKDCVRLLTEAGLQLPAVYARGYPNANCIGCVKATSPTYWNHVRKDAPDVFARRAEQSRRIGARLVEYKGNRLFLDELHPDAKGRPLKNFSAECGVFCETIPPPVN